MKKLFTLLIAVSIVSGCSAVRSSTITSDALNYVVGGEHCFQARGEICITLNFEPAPPKTEFLKIDDVYAEPYGQSVNIKAKYTPPGIFGVITLNAPPTVGAIYIRGDELYIPLNMKVLKFNVESGLAYINLATKKKKWLPKFTEFVDPKDVPEDWQENPPPVIDEPVQGEEESEEKDDKSEESD